MILSVEAVMVHTVLPSSYKHTQTIYLLTSEARHFFPSELGESGVFWLFFFSCGQQQLEFCNNSNKHTELCQSSNISVWRQHALLFCLKADGEIHQRCFYRVFIGTVLLDLNVYTQKPCDHLFGSFWLAAGRCRIFSFVHLPQINRWPIWSGVW